MASLRTWTTRQCADHLGLTTDFIRNEIAEGRLRARRDLRCGAGERAIWLIDDVDFRAYLVAVGWKRLPVTMK